MKKKVNAKTNMYEHSKAKVELYGNYLATYLNILSRVKFVDEIYIYDLMCGEGIYEDGSEGSPIVAMKNIKNHYFSNNKTCPNLEVLFNDKDKSEIEGDKYKIDRVKLACSNIYKPNNVNIAFRKEDYSKIYNEVIKKLIALSNGQRALIFLDPYGYKEIKSEHLMHFLQNGKTELLLFLPVSFMSRVANKSLSNDEFPGGEPLRKFLEPLFEFGENKSTSTKPYVFIRELKELFSRYLKDENIFVDTFTIERDRQNVYSLFFFTPHILGFEKMLEAKWKLDEQQGRGFRFNSNEDTFFPEVEMSDYPGKLKEYVSANTKTNSDLYLFGLKNGFLPRHTNQVLKEWQNTGLKFKVYLFDGNEARKNSFYISHKNYGAHPEKVVKFTFE